MNDNDTQGLAYQQELEHQEYLLTKESFEKWLSENYKLALTNIYLKEHGLPLDSEIKGLL